MTHAPLATLTLAQGSTSGPAASSGPPAPGEAPGHLGPLTTAPAGAPGTAPSGASPMGNEFLVIIALLLVGMIVFSIFGQRRDKRKREAMISAIKKHDRVQTIGGVIGSVVEVKPDYVVLKVDESSNTRITFSRSAIQQVLSQGPESSAPGNGAEFLKPS